jgi:hypothetical protein
MKTSFTYTVLRYVHDTTTGEFVNVGVALYAPKVRYASALCRTTYGRLSKAFPGIDGESFRGLMRHIQSRFEELGDRYRSELPLGELPKSALDLAHTILPRDDSSLQWSPAGGGLTEDASATLESLFDRLVMRYDERPPVPTRTDEDVWRKYRRNLESRHVLKHLQPKKIVVEDDEVEFQYAWKNGVWHCLEPLSFDLSSRDSIKRKAHEWLGQIQSVSKTSEPFKLYLLLGEPQEEELRSAFDKAVSILGKVPVEKEIVRERNAGAFSENFALEIQKHAVEGNPMSDKRIYVEQREEGDWAVRRAGSERASDVLPTQKEAIDRAKELEPDATPHVERVRHTDQGGPDKWRSP